MKIKVGDNIRHQVIEYERPPPECSACKRLQLQSPPCNFCHHIPPIQPQISNQLPGPAPSIGGATGGARTDNNEGWQEVNRRRRGRRGGGEMNQAHRTTVGPPNSNTTQNPVDVRLHSDKAQGTLPTPGAHADQILNPTPMPSHTQTHASPRHELPNHPFLGNPKEASTSQSSDFTVRKSNPINSHHNPRPITCKPQPPNVSRSTSNTTQTSTTPCTANPQSGALTQLQSTGTSPTHS